MRADQLLVHKGLVPTRSAAQRLIEHGGVRWLGPKGWAVPRKAGEDLPEDCELQITDDAELRFVSRGGLKLEGALARCGIDVRGLDCLDAGQGTGGFTDALLHHGAASVVGFDVGHGQLHPKLAADPRVQCFESVNARDVSATPFAETMQGRQFGLIVGDLSFISSTLAWPALLPYLAPDGVLLWLIKPQFELQPGQIGKGGIVRDKSLFAVVEQRMWDTCRALSLKCRAYFPSPIAGGDGNAEFFVWAQHRPPVA
jgi:23S rRNA (cytidine1920-2'-O)/16S rRNA (cytidine1409-2'-O)-methyltransferase